MALVLNTGVDSARLAIRRLILEEAGHIVVTKEKDEEIARACQNFQFDIVIIGHSVTVPFKRRIFNLARTYCKSAKVLELTSSDSGKVLHDADSWLEIDPMQPDGLEERVNLLCRR